MRIVSAIDRPLRDEHVIGTDPEMKPSLPGEWRKRVNAFNGRALSAEALTGQQDGRDGHQRLLGQGVSPGPVRGLNASWTRPSTDAPNDSIRIEPGFGITADGEDVVIQTPRQIRVMDLPVYLPVAARNAFFDAQHQISSPARGSGAIAGAPHLPPPLPRCVLASLAAIAAAPAAAAGLPRVAILIAEPVVLEVSARGDAADPCARDPRNDPYDDLRLIDGARLSLYLWPDEMRAADGIDAPDYGLPPRDPAFRNALAHTIFSVERGFLPGDAHPWERAGLPLGLLAFDGNWAVDFLDSASVVRAGGQPRPRTQLVRQSGNPMLWQARVSQFIEQMAELGNPDIPHSDLSRRMRQLPPVGLLPAEAFDAVTRRQNLFSSGFDVRAAPVALEQVEIAVRESASLRPFDLARPDEVELLIPVPERVYEPGLLLQASVDPAFATAISRFKADRDNWLGCRETVRRRRDVLLGAISGQRSVYPAKDPEETAAERTAPLGATRLVDVASHGFRSASSPLPVSPGDQLFVWAKVVEEAGQLSLKLTGAQEMEVRWESPALVAAGAWKKLEAPVAAAFLATGMVFGQQRGKVEWGPAGKTDAAGAETIFVSDDIPLGATSFANDVDASWPWQRPVQDTEDGFGTVQKDDRRFAVDIAAFVARHETSAFVKDDLAIIGQGGIDGFAAKTTDALKAANDLIDLGFVRARADTYRIRQYMLGNDAASRLVTSPAIADLAARDESARATGANIKEFIAGLSTAKLPDPALRADAAIERAVTTSGIISNNLLAGLTDGPSLRFGSRIADAAAAAISPSLFTNVVGGAGLDLGQPVVRRGASAFKDETSLSGLAAFAGVSIALPSDVGNQQPLSGFTERSLSVAERLGEPPSVLAHRYALASKKAVIEGLLAMLGDGQPLKGVFGGIKLAGIKKVIVNADVVEDEEEDDNPGTLADLKAAPDGFRELDGAPKENQRHESGYFNAAVRAIDNTISMLRQAEGHVGVYAKALEDAKSVKAGLQQWIAKADARLRAIEVELAEARHDVSVTAALLREEDSRVTALNTRRAAILRDHVKVIIFRRPRETSRVTVVPAVSVSSALAELPVAACLREHPGVPDELRQMAEAFRNAPVAWFPSLAKAMAFFDRPVHVESMFRHVKMRAGQAAAFIDQAPFAGPKLLLAAQKAIHSGQTVFAAKRPFGLALEVGMIHTEGMAASLTRLKSVALLGDLIDSGHGRAEASQEAAEELSRITQTAACLHASFAETPPAARLAWAETLSEFDAPVPLASLSALAGWQGLSLELKREQQGLVDFLYARINSSIPEARAAVDQLVRVALLMAAHAPVDKLVAARIARPAPARPGAIFELSLDLAKVRIGMSVSVLGALGGVMASAVIEDVAGGVAKARVKDAPNPGAIMDEKAVVHLTEAFVPKMKVFPQVFGKR
jgi:hypothetical protein